MEGFGYFLLFGVICFFGAIITGFTKETSKKNSKETLHSNQTKQTFEETENEIHEICQKLFACDLAILLSMLLIFVEIGFFFISFFIYCYSFYLLIFIIRFYFNIKTKDLSYVVLFIIVIQIINYIIPIAFVAIPFCLIRRKKQRELLKMFSEKE